MIETRNSFASLNYFTGAVVSKAYMRTEIYFQKDTLHTVMCLIDKAFSRVELYSHYNIYFYGISTIIVWHDAIDH